MSHQHTYTAFLAQKYARTSFPGIAETWMPTEHLFPFQQRITSWAMQQGRCALFLDTGLGKTRQQLVWAQNVVRQQGDVLILAPLAVAKQTAQEAAGLGIQTTIARTTHDVRPGITISNYERLHLMPMERFTGVVLDESSILKSLDGKTRQAVTTACAHIPYRLCCTATPAPNDHMELANHAEFLGVMTRQEMLSTYFVHDGGSTASWRLKGHAVDKFWQWVASWAVALTHPKDLGDMTPGYTLPPLTMTHHRCATPATAESGMLFAMEATTLHEQRQVRRASIGQRVEAMAQMVRTSADAWVIWCGLNDESQQLTAAIPGAVEVSGAHSLDDKQARIEAFTAGDVRVLVSKPSICGFGMNWQHCAHMGFVGISHSFETWYQAIRRCWRFGQTRPVNVHLVYTEAEQPIARNLARKERDAQAMQRVMAQHLLQFFTMAERQRYAPTRPIVIPAWLTSEEPAHVASV